MMQREDITQDRARGGNEDTFSGEKKRESKHNSDIILNSPTA